MIRFNVAIADNDERYDVLGVLEAGTLDVRLYDEPNAPLTINSCEFVSALGSSTMVTIVLSNPIPRIAIVAAIKARRIFLKSKRLTKKLKKTTPNAVNLT